MNLELPVKMIPLSKSSIAVDVKTDIKKVEKYLLNEKKFLDPNLKNKSKTVEEKIQFYMSTIKFLIHYLLKLKLVNLEHVCNRKCSFCPRSDPSFVERKEFITNDLHLKLCKELEQINYKGTIRYSQDLWNLY